MDEERVGNKRTVTDEEWVMKKDANNEVMEDKGKKPNVVKDKWRNEVERNEIWGLQEQHEGEKDEHTDK